MYTDIFLGLIIVVLVLLGYFTRKLFTVNRRCINCGDYYSKHDGVKMAEGFVCSECLHKTADPLLPDGCDKEYSKELWNVPEEDGWKEHAEAHYAAEEHERQRQEFMDSMHRNGIPIEDWFFDYGSAIVDQAEADERIRQQVLVKGLMAGEPLREDRDVCGIHGDMALVLHTFCPAPYRNLFDVEVEWREGKEWVGCRYGELGWFGKVSTRLRRYSWEINGD